MKDTSLQNQVQEQPVRKPIRRSLMIGSLVFFAALSIMLAALSYLFFSSSLYSRYNAKLDEIITYVENHADADDLKECIQTGQPSAHYMQLQRFLNGMIDDFKLEYLYIVIPSDTTMTNVISATSAAERAAGEADMQLLQTTDAYPAEQLARYCSYWDTEQINYFEETSSYGDYYTACKALRDSNGETVALICADISIETLHLNVYRLQHPAHYACFLCIRDVYEDLVTKQGN